jgi:hypothetical protein
LVWELPALDVQDRACPIFEFADRFVIIALDGVAVVTGKLRSENKIGVI